MAIFSKQLLSVSSSGTGVVVVATVTAGTAVHVAHATAKDEVWMYAVNTSSAGVKLTIEFGSVTATQNIEQTIPAESGLVLVVPGIPISGGKTVAAFASTASVICIYGYVNRIT